jgi:cellulose synthase/poly-beta-1,6-N-acetylglucosamine synthase-like glycosyltransferase
MILLILYWAALFTIIYTFILFPGLIVLRGLLINRPYRRTDITPSVSLVIAAYNEASTIGKKIENILALDYPRELLEVIIASDGSTDNTEEIIQGYEERGIKLLALPRLGKNPVLTAAAEAATNDILIFSDANSMYAPDAIRLLVKAFADPKVGGVAGNQVYLSDRRMASQTAGERGYWSFDRMLKVFESRAGNVISATGSIYAIRRQLFRPIAPGLVDDFITSTEVIIRGYRLVFAEDALAFEGVAHSRGLEFNRKVRITLQGLKSVLLRRELMNPRRYGFYAVQLFSHKLLRRLVVFPLIIVFLTSPFLWNRGIFYQLSTLAQVAFYACALVGLILAGYRLGKLKIFTVPFYFSMIYAAAFVAVIKLLKGQEITRWETPVRDPVSDT